MCNIIELCIANLYFLFMVSLLRSTQRCIIHLAAPAAAAGDPVELLDDCCLYISLGGENTAVWGRECCSVVSLPPLKYAFEVYVISDKGFV